MILSKKWEGKLVYPTNVGEVQVREVNGLAIAEESDPLKIKALKRIHRFCEYHASLPAPQGLQSGPKTKVKVEKSTAKPTKAKKSRSKTPKK
jgi:hypothetical protein